MGLIEINQLLFAYVHINPASDPVGTTGCIYWDKAAEA
jgi:hypothetical protein